MSAKDLPEILVTSGGGYELADLEKRFSEDRRDYRRVVGNGRPVILIATARSLSRGGPVGRQVRQVPSGDRTARAAPGRDPAGAIAGGSGCADQARVELPGIAGGLVAGRRAQYSASAGRLQISRRVGGKFRAPGQSRLAGFCTLASDLSCLWLFR